MRITGKFTLAAMFALAAGVPPALAQPLEDGAVCALLGGQPSGLYFVSSGTDRPVIQRVGQAALNYDRNARFYYVPRMRTRVTRPGAEAVWHIRTQTRAAASPSADAAYVYRSAVRTQCSQIENPNRDLSWFDNPDYRFVEIDRYIDHHSSPGQPVRAKDDALNARFHFRIKDRTLGCINTDSRERFPNQGAIYGFDDVERTEAIAEGISYAGTAAAAPVSPKYAGLSSEFAYQMIAPACFGFAAPFPTRMYRVRWLGPDRMQQALDAARDWRPLQTLIVLKRMRGRVVTEVANRTINWTR